MRLYGKALSKQIADTTSGNQARLMFGAMTKALSNAYATLANYSSGTPSTLLQATGIGSAALLGAVFDAGDVQAARDYLDGVNQMLQSYYPHMPISDEALDGQQLAELRAAVSGTSTAAYLIDDMFSTFWLSQLCDDIIEAIGTVGAKVAATVAKVAGATIGGWWWLILVGLGIAFVWSLWIRKVVLP